MSENNRFLFEDLKKSSDQILLTLSQIIGINTFFVAVNDSTTNFILKALNKNETLINEGTLPLCQTYCSLVINSEEELLLIPDTSSNPLTSGMEITNEIGSSSFVGVPIQLRDGTKIGTICGLDHKPFAFTEKELNLLKSMASLLGNVVELENMALRDNMTQVYNRNYLDLYFADEWKHKHEKIAFLFFDLDNFKTINDVYDHNIGDHVLKSFASILKTSITRNDILCRIGGDEFLVIVLDYDSEAAITEMVERVQQQLKTPILTPVGNISISTSIGVSLYPQDGIEISDLIKKSDRAMYTVKHNGKNDFYFYQFDSTMTS